MTTSADRQIGAHVAQLRDDRGMTRAALSKVLRDAGLEHMHPTTVSRIEKGERAVRLSEALTLAEALGTDLATLLGVEGGTSDTIREDFNELKRQVTTIYTMLRPIIEERRMQRATMMML